MKKWTAFCSILLTLCLCSKHLSAQYYFYNDKYLNSDVLFEAGINMGLTNCYTDLGGYQLPYTKPMVGLSVGFLYQNFIGARLDVNYGNIAAEDKAFSNYTKSYLRRRNLSFKSAITELELMGEFHPLMLKFYQNGVPRISPYLLAGIGIFHFNPQTKYKGHWVDLQPLHTEGEGFPEYKATRENYHLTQINFPLGIGIKYEISDQWNIRGETIFRLLSTDYLDDVSTTYINPALFDQHLSSSNASLAKALYYRGGEINPAYKPKIGGSRGSKNGNDLYYSINLKISYVFGLKKEGIRYQKSRF